ncbi:protein transport protein SEC16A homolog [Humulus lupulus]|uniref:protein transport protein SEC16A homolog n=1 Tax=Humulus lupulus TaxID=3486 RepID=UPI002B40C077|nr:protein transport protein SEC16A homolog [Humulus lupulus]XP_062074744.1 protein transport protein SEC16A homolog [Humulus lupulus]
MASNPPPFEVEDQTDEDFFDKLVDDDFGPTESSAPKFTEGNDSDDAKAFANLSIGDESPALEDFSREGGVDEPKTEKGAAQMDAVDVSEQISEKGVVEVSAKDENSGVSASSTLLDAALEPKNDGAGSELRSDSVSNESGSAGFKVVGWSSFHADSAQNGGHGFGSYSDFFSELDAGVSGEVPGKVGEDLTTQAKIAAANEEHRDESLNGMVNYAQHQEGQNFGAHVEQNTNVQDLNTSQYWENLYPGWKYDLNTGQWYQVDVVDPTAHAQSSFGTNSASDWTAISDVKTEISYMQQTPLSAVGTAAKTNTYTEQSPISFVGTAAETNTYMPQASTSVVGTAAETNTYMQQTSNSVVGHATETSASQSVSNWNQPSQANNGYPEHMIFDPQYPGWYYDTIAQEWRSLDTYTSTVQSTVQDYSQQNQNGVVSSNMYSQNKSSSFEEYRQDDKYGSRGLGGQGQEGGWTGSYNSSNQNNQNMWQAEVPKSATLTAFGGSQQLSNSYGSQFSTNENQQASLSSFGAVQSYNRTNQGHNEANGTMGFQGFNAVTQPFNQANVSDQNYISNDYYGNQKPANFSQQLFSSGNQLPYSPSVGRSPDGRPLHALVTFGFGGKLIVMKDHSNLGNSSYGSQGPVGGIVSVLNLQEVVTENTNVSTSGSCNYLRALYQQSFPGPLVGGNVGSKELNKWIDERITNCDSSDMDSKKAQTLKLLLSLLKIACQHYGKLRSPFGSEVALKDNDTPESAVAKLFASAKRSSAQFSEYGAVNHCLQKLPSEAELQATASEVQNLLVSGRKREALQYAQEGQLWGPALVLASQLGDQFYVDTIKQMAFHQLAAGSPLRTLCLLIAGQPAEVFSVNAIADGSLPGSVTMFQQPAQFGTSGMLDDWEENLAVITANRTKDDELVIIHLGDCLWKERSEITGAHICYVVAEANFESYSDSARLCLIGADHWKFPRTYASPEAIQRTELYEYSKVLGNSQFILLPFQPYKLVYAHMLAEVGKVSDSLKYCQAILKSLKTGRAPEVETWKQLVLSLEERIRTHQQGGYASNLAPTKLVGKLLNFFDSTAHRVVGGLPPPAPSTSHGSVHGNEHLHQQQMAPRVSSSQSTMAMSSLMPSASMEPISEWAADGNKMTMPNRSVSEPDFGRTPRQVDSSKEVTSADSRGKGSASGGTSRMSRFGFGSQLLQKTMGLVLRPRSGRQAKLGEENKFYYDEKLKRWVEEGVEAPAEEAALPPPPTMTAFQNGMSDYSLKSALKSEVSPPGGSPDSKSSTPEYSSGIPPIPPSSNQFSARGRMGVRSRYVDTFNQGGGRPANLFQSPSIPSVKPAVAANAKFFIPTPASGEQSMEAIAESVHEDVPTVGAHEEASTSTVNDAAFQVPPPSASIQRFPSMGNIPSQRVMSNGNGSLSSHSRRTASWSGSFNDSFTSPKGTEVKPLVAASGMPPTMFSPSDPSLMRTQMNGGNFADELQEVEL